MWGASGGARGGFPAFGGRPRCRSGGGREGSTPDTPPPLPLRCPSAPSPLRGAGALVTFGACARCQGWRSLEKFFKEEPIGVFGSPVFPLYSPYKRLKLNEGRVVRVGVV